MKYDGNISMKRICQENVGKKKKFLTLRNGNDDKQRELSLPISW